MSVQNPETYLELCNRMAQEAGVNGDPMTAVVTGQTGEKKRVCDWINDALLGILGNHLWTFLWEAATITVPLNANVVAQAIPAARYNKEATWLIPAGSNSDRELDYIDWREFSRTYRVLASPGAINAWTIRPDNAFVVNAKSLDAAGTVINCERYIMPTPLVNASDEPPIPAHLRMIIVWAALKKYAGYDEAGSQRTVAVDEYRDKLAQLNELCLPSFTFGGGLLDNY